MAACIRCETSGILDTGRMDNAICHRLHAENFCQRMLGKGEEQKENSQMSAQSLFYVPVDDDEDQDEDGWQQQSSITVSKLFRNLKTHFHSFSR